MDVYERLVYERLEHATTAIAKATILHDLIVNVGKVFLPGNEDQIANLEGVNLGRDAINHIHHIDGHIGNLCPCQIDGRLNLSQANLKYANMKQAILTDVNLTGAILDYAILESANLTGASARSIQLVGANLQSACLCNTILSLANLELADLRNAQFCDTVHISTDLSNANLAGAKLDYVEFPTLIPNLYLSGATLNETKFQFANLGGRIGEELDARRAKGDNKALSYHKARVGYLSLKHYFTSRGEHDAATWAYLRERRMETSAAWANKHFGQYIRNMVVQGVCDYGESIPRVLVTMFLVCVVFTLVYSWTGWIETYVSDPIERLFRLVTFSLGSMTTTPTPPELAKPTSWIGQIAAEIEGLLGIASIGLMGFIAGNRIRRR